jgi:hypothetical protein
MTSPDFERANRGNQVVAWDGVDDRDLMEVTTAMVVGQHR